MLKERFARNVKLQRESRQWTQEVAAEKCDLSPRYWGKIERADVAVSIEVMEKISVGMEVPIADLLWEEPEDAGPLYQPVKEVRLSPELGRYLTYGIRALGSPGSEVTVHDVTTRDRSAQRLARLLNTSRLSPIHLRDVVEDLISQ